MRINGDVSKVSGIYSKNKNVGKVDKTESTTTKKDIISISNQAKDFQTAMKTLKDIPDIRHDKVSGIQDKYDKGEYNISSNDLADKLINSIKNKNE
ncbi:flagellar biosynthesis anti-sigma factor FlgM [Pseudobacteroides cellulosolvens]|uniref:Negative regulator of flagellin synthesis n=1 Tax=Pseudobacteroides cellulosolvens ATCC 35603 = DSM 2933 TaxID=398512 RepID=A0A0L6JSC5_9FIRM|nr:flagellar biosynthesis anti-sigma factor FlgM [Pseudobacteroides cellulosolvens]KNY28630.1 flagellar biosynthesis anti-sigma factor protein FlgM [Pseudobacteroides cellulosolvens ATCC 35603 = DSM 2933]